LALIEILAPTPEGYPVIALISLKNLIDNFNIFTAKFLGLDFSFLL
jgi:hypothetical protein